MYVGSRLFLEYVNSILGKKIGAITAEVVNKLKVTDFGSLRSTSFPKYLRGCVVAYNIVREIFARAIFTGYYVTHVHMEHILELIDKFVEQGIFVNTEIEESAMYGEENVGDTNKNDTYMDELYFKHSEYQVRHNNLLGIVNTLNKWIDTFNTFYDFL